MKEEYMRSVLFSASSEETLISCLDSIPGYKLLHDAEGSYHPFTLISPSGNKINIRHEKGLSHATTSNILPQDHNDNAVAYDDDEAVKLLYAARNVDSLEVSLNISKHDEENLRK